MQTGRDDSGRVVYRLEGMKVGEFIRMRIRANVGVCVIISVM